MGAVPADTHYLVHTVRECKRGREKIPEMPRFTDRLKITTRTARIPPAWEE